MNINLINVSPEIYKDEGLYIYGTDSNILELTYGKIKQAAADYWSNTDKIPENVKESRAFERCPFCPLIKTGGLCDAIRPVLPFLDHIDKYVSFDKVKAVYKEKDKDVIYYSECSMQQALQYVSVLSLIHYCQAGKKYKKYFLGLIPLMRGKDLATTLYKNMYFLHKGNEEEISGIIKTFYDEISVSSQNQAKRLRMICKNDAFINAIIKTQIITEFLSSDIKEDIKYSFEKD